MEHFIITDSNLGIPTYPVLRRDLDRVFSTMKKGYPDRSFIAFPVEYKKSKRLISFCGAPVTKRFEEVPMDITLASNTISQYLGPYMPKIAFNIKMAGVRNKRG